MGCREAPRVNLAAPAALRELLGSDLRELPAKEDELCVVGIFGKAAARLLSDKHSLVNTLCDRQVFPLFRKRGEPDAEEECNGSPLEEPQDCIRKQGGQDKEEHQHNRKQGVQEKEEHNRNQGGQDMEERQDYNRKSGGQDMEEYNDYNRKSGGQDMEEHNDYNRMSGGQGMEEHIDYSSKSGGQAMEDHNDYNRKLGGQDLDENKGYNRKLEGQDMDEHQGYRGKSGGDGLDDDDDDDEEEDDEDDYDRKEEEEEGLDLEDHQEQDYNLIQAYHSQESKVLFLVLTSVFDCHELLEACRALGEDTPHAEAHDFWKQEEKLYCMHLLYLFSVCHILLLAHPTCSFDITYDKVFRALDTLRQKLLPSLKTSIKDCAVGLDWKLNCRSCPPRLLFVFQLNGALKVESKTLDSLNEKPKKHSPKRRLQHALEDQIYRIFRKSRVLTNQSVNCLFTVPANQAFVYIMTGQNEDPIGMLLEQLKHNCVLRDNESSIPISGPRRFQMMRHSRQLSFNIESNTTSSGQLVDCTLKEFLFQHVDLVLTKKGFDDSVGRNPQPSHFELPTYQKWISVALKLYEAVIENKDDEPAPFIGGLTAKVLGNMKVLEGFLDADTKFSENRCQKALPMAHSAYQSNLPHNYTTTIHKNQLSQALRVYSQHARGPAFQKYAMHLSEDCYKFWSSGHQLCEERSLTDQHCVHKFHLLPKTGEKTEPERNPPILYHNSRARSTGSCNCGRKQAPRDDPFHIRAANYEFYQLLEEKCCGKLDHINFPIFQPSTPDPAPAMNEEELDSPQEGEIEKIKDKEPQTQGESTSLSLALSLGQSMESLGTFPADPQAGGDNPETHGQGVEAKIDKRPSLIDRQASTVEYLPGMLHSNCPKGLLPKFSSWSLLKLGSAKSYNFHTGLDQLGFIPGTNYLMPWDIVIRTRAEDEGDLDTNSWPAPNKAVPGKRNAVVMGRGRRRDDIARAFVGFEYEDSRGRRVLSSGPDKIMKVMGSGPKESAIKALNTDMPLYILSPSQGRGLKPHYAQLMRVFVVVPDAPLQIVLAPQVQPGPPPCPIFYPEKQELTLPPDGLWVLRFPYSYATEAGPCYPPKENQQLMSFKVLRGVVKAITQ